VAPWLYETAYRVAMKAKVSAARRRAYESEASELPRPEPADDVAWRELRLVLDEELNRLPEKYRDPLVLCYLQGKTNEEAAQELGWPVGSMSWRLDKGRQLLRSQLARRGLVLSAGAFSTALADQASAALPTALVDGAVGAALSFAGSHVNGSVAGPVLALAQG